MLQAVQLGGILFAIAADAHFLDLEVTELLFEVQEGVHLDEGALQFAAIGELLVEQLQAVGVEGHFEGGDAVESRSGPPRFGRARIRGGRRPELVDEILNVAAIDGSVVRRQENRAARQAGPDGVEADLALPSAVRGPVDRCELAALAARRAGEGGLA